MLSTVISYTCCGHFQHCHSLPNHLHQLDIKITQFFPSNFQTLWLERNNAFLLATKISKDTLNSLTKQMVLDFTSSIGLLIESIQAFLHQTLITLQLYSQQVLNQYLHSCLCRHIGIYNRVADSYWTSRWIELT